MILVANTRRDGSSTKGNAMNDFHVVLHADESTAGKFAKSFEQVSESLEKLPRLYLEADGSFVWVIERSGDRFQLDGLLTDDGANLLHCELKGVCDSETLDQLLQVFGWPEQKIGVQLVQVGTFLSESEFRSQFID